MVWRPIFLPSPTDLPFIKEVEVNFTWHPGLAVSQAQKSIASLHEAAASLGYSPLLEISSKSQNSLGIALSAFNLVLQAPDGQKMSVESAFQGSKVFVNSGPFHDLYRKSSREAKLDERVRKSGDVVLFDFKGEEYPTQPLTAFYDWLYLTALFQNPQLSRQLLQYNGFTDIVFNPEKSFNCQARSAALYVGFVRAGIITKVMGSWNDYFAVISSAPKKSQPGLPF